MSARLLVTAAVIACLAAASPVQAQVPATLTEETLVGNPGQANVTCTGSEEDFTIRWDVTGVATGPYPGTFHETGSHVGPGVDVVRADFQIDSPSGRVVGTKSFVPDAPLGATPCTSAGAGSFGLLRYEATIVTPEGRFTDRGVADTLVSDLSPRSGNATFSESFVSDFTEPIPLPGPTSKEQCKNGGWRQFGFKNQGQCVAFVQRGPRRSR